jgi:hypothetical protein
MGWGGRFVRKEGGEVLTDGCDGEWWVVLYLYWRLAYEGSCRAAGSRAVSFPPFSLTKIMTREDTFYEYYLVR